MPIEKKKSPPPSEDVDLEDIQFATSNRTKETIESTVSDDNSAERDSNVTKSIRGNFPLPIARRLKDKKLIFEYTSEILKPEHFVFIDCYLYRTYPVINRKITTMFNYIDCISQPFDEAYVLKEHGSGGYKLLMASKNQARTTGDKTRGGQFLEAVFEIEDSEVPPKLIYAEVETEHPSNKRYVEKLKAEGIISAKGEVVSPNNGGITNNDALIGLLREVINKQGGNQGRPDSSFETVSKMFGETHQATIQMMKDQMKTDDPDKMFKIMQLFMSMQQKPESNNNLVEMLFKVQSEAKATESALMLKMMDMMQKQNTPASEDAEDKMLKRMMMYKEFFGGDGESHSTTKKSTIEVIAEHVAPLVGKGLDIGLSILSMQNFKKGLEMKQQTETTSQAPQTPQIPQGPTTPQPTPSPITQEPLEAVEVNPEEQVKITLTSQADYVASSILKGVSGWDFAQSMYTILKATQSEAIANETLTQMAGIGKDKLFTIIKETPALWGKVSGVASQVEKFSEEFIEFCEGEDEEDEIEGIKNA